jgi:N-acetyl-gamma-glutamyl-phosphate reductase
VKAGVIGATGYLGAELFRLLADHPVLDVVVAQAESSAGSRIGEQYPSLARAYRDLVVDPVDLLAVEHLDVVFVAVPSGTSQEIIGQLAGSARLVVDLGADFRLKDPALYPQWYGFEHSRPELLDDVVYGMPELFRKELVSARLVAAPGCYVTAACLALAPFLRGGHIEPTGIVVDAASGTSGGGKSPSAAFHHPFVNERLAPYGVLNHRHTPEMQQVLGAELLFTPHLAPMTRGILATCYARPRAGNEGLASTEDAIAILRDAYRNEPFVNVSDNLVSTAEAYGSNVCHLTARLDERTGWLIVFSAIDNLVKGGSGQAIQAANLALGLPETAGLPLVGLAP